MRFAAAISEARDPDAALQAALEQVTAQMAGHPVHAAFLFASGLYDTAWGPRLGRLADALGRPFLMGCTAGGILGVDQELEGVAALTLAAGSLPGVTLHPFTVTRDDLAEPRGSGFWIEKVGATPAERPIGLLLPDPLTCDVPTLMAALGHAYPTMPMIGGLASGAAQHGENLLFHQEAVLTDGAVGLVLTGNITLQTIVAQGCRPIGRPYIVTKAEENVILELAGAPATEVLRELFSGLSPSEKGLAHRALFLGIVMDEHRHAFQRGDFLIRNLIGLDPATGALALGDQIRAGQTVQFQLRDADTSREDLQHLLREQQSLLAAGPPAGALLFSCLGRGRDLYGEPHYDIRTIQAAIGPCPLAGFFCNGEIGPVGGRNFLHGFTSSIGLFRPRTPG